MGLLIDRKMPYMADMLYEKSIALGSDKYLLSLQRARLLKLMKRQDEAMKALNWALQNAPTPKRPEEHVKIESYLKYLSNL